MRALDFLKNIYNLHGHQVAWAIIEEIRKHRIKKEKEPFEMLLDYALGKEDEEEVETKSELKLGLFIKGSRVYVDLFARRFFSTINLPELERKVYPAKRVLGGNGMVAFEAKEDMSKHIVLSKTFLQDIYGVTQYGEWMEERLLL